MSETTRSKSSLLALNPSSPIGKEVLARAAGRALPQLAALLSRAALVLAAVWLFILALQLIKTGAGGLRPLLDALSVDGILGHMGLGWFGSYVVMSGSPVAAVAISLFSGGAISDLEAFAMINGTRMGASLIVLVAGFVSYVTGRRNPDGLYVGVVALLTALTLWGPAMPLGLLLLDRGWLDGVQVSSPGALTSFVGFVSDPLVEPLAAALPEVLLFLTGMAVLVGSFTLFDRALPSLERPGPRLEALSRALQQRHAMFLFGSLVTLVTLSVSLSVTILVPLALKGYVRRDRIIPYVMGANITTWIDTLLATLLLDSPRAFTVVLTEMIAGGTISLLVLIVLYKQYTSVILGLAHRASSSRRNLSLTLACLGAMPLLLLIL